MYTELQYNSISTKDRRGSERTYVVEFLVQGSL